MADRVSTFRFKAEGLETVGSELRKYAAQFRAQLSQANKLFSEGMLGEQMGVDPAKLKDTFDKGVETYISSQNKMKQFEAASWVATKKQYADAERAAGEHAKILAERESPILDQAAQSNKTATKAFDESRPKEAARLKADILARDSAKQEEVKDQKKAVSEMDKIDSDFASVTMTKQQKQLENLRQVWLRKRQLYKGDSAEIAKIDAETIAAQDRILAGGTGKGARDGMGLSGFGGRMVLGHAVGQVGGEILGDAKAGQAIGSIVSATMFGGPVVGAAVAAMEVVGAGVKVYRENVEAAKKATREFAGAMYDLTAAWSGFGTTLIQYGSFGQTMEKEFHRASDAVMKLQLDVTQQANSPKNANDVLSYVMGWKSARASAIETDTMLSGVQSGAAAQALKYRDKDYKAYLADQRQTLGVQQAMVPVAAMQTGFLKQQAELNDQIAERNATRRAKQGEETRQAQAAITMAEKERDSIHTALSKPGLNQEQTDTLTAALEGATERANDARTALGRLPQQQQMENATATAENQRQQNTLAASAREAMAQQQHKTNMEVVRATTLGYAQRLALQREADQEELRQARGQGAAMVAEKQKEIDARIAAEKVVRAEDLAQQQAKAHEADVAAKSDQYHRERAVKRAQYDEELRQAARKSPEELAIKQAEVAARIATDHKQLMEQQTIKTNEAILAAQTIGYARQKALREFAYQEELKMARAESEELYQLKLKEIAALRQVEAEANRQNIEDRMARFSPGAAVSQFHREMDDLKARGATDSQLRAMQNETLTGSIRRQTEHDRIDLAVKTRKLNQLQADVLNAMVDNPMARANSAEGAQVRKAIVEEAKMRYLERGADVMQVGSFNSKYQAGYVDISHVNLNRPLDMTSLQKRANAIGEKMLEVLQKMADNGGLG